MRARPHRPTLGLNAAARMLESARDAKYWAFFLISDGEDSNLFATAAEFLQGGNGGEQRDLDDVGGCKASCIQDGEEIVPGLLHLRFEAVGNTAVGADADLA